MAEARDRVCAARFFLYRRVGHDERRIELWHALGAELSHVDMVVTALPEYAPQMVTPAHRRVSTSSRTAANVSVVECGSTPSSAR